MKIRSKTFGTNDSMRSKRENRHKPTLDCMHSPIDDFEYKLQMTASDATEKKGISRLFFPFATLREDHVDAVAYVIAARR